MATRKLVEIFPYNYRQFQALRNLNRKAGLPIPSIPFLVNEAIKRGLPSVATRFTPQFKAYDTQDKVSSK